MKQLWFTLSCDNVSIRNSSRSFLGEAFSDHIRPHSGPEEWFPPPYTLEVTLGQK